MRAAIPHGLNLFATTSLGILLATIARSIPQFGTLMILVLLHLQTQLHRLSAQSADVRSAEFTQPRLPPVTIKIL